MWRSRHREWIEQWAEENRRLAEEGRKRHEDWLVEWRERVAAERKEQKRRFDALDAAMENDKRVTDEIVLELQAARARDTVMLERVEAESRTLIEGLMRVFDRLDGNDGPRAEGA